MLLSDIALPVLLSVWRDYYAPIVEQSKTTAERLSVIKRRDFRWDHAQAGAWILKFWDFTDEIVCFVGAHNLSMAEIQQLGLEETIARLLSVTSLLPSMLSPREGRLKLFIDALHREFTMRPEEFADLITEVQINFDGIRDQFDLMNRKNNHLFENLINI